MNLYFFTVFNKDTIKRIAKCGLILYLVRCKYPKSGGEALCPPFHFEIVRWATGLRHFLLLFLEPPESFASRAVLSTGTGLESIQETVYEIKTTRENREEQKEGGSSSPLSPTPPFMATKELRVHVRNWPVWKANSLVNLVVGFSHPQSPQQLAWWFFGLNCLAIGDLGTKQTPRFSP